MMFLPLKYAEFKKTDLPPSDRTVRFLANTYCVELGGAKLLCEAVPVTKEHPDGGWCLNRDGLRQFLQATQRKAVTHNLLR